MRPFLLLIFAMSTLLSQTVRAEGDQFLDGIGETALIARYELAGSLNDGSRNSLHASMEHGEAVFVEDDLFGTVLDLSGAPEDTALRIPGEALAGQQSLSVAGWAQLSGEEAGPLFFNFKTDRMHRFGCAATVADDGGGLSVFLVDGEERVRLDAPSLTAKSGDWMHWAVVLDRAHHSLVLYVDGRRVAVRDDVRISLEDILNASRPASNDLLLAPPLNGKLYDVRLYRIALTDPQVAVIHHNAISDDTWGQENRTDELQGDYRTDHARSLTPGLVDVPDVEVRTAVGVLPHLPVELPGVYADGANGPAVRVLWPASKDRAPVQRAGSYRVTGQVPGTDFQPIATVVVAEARSDVAPAGRILEEFPLGHVVLTAYPDGSPTPFMQHRDKFIEGLAASNPDSFLYNFRNAFGQPQPEGATPLYGWDSQDCRLRGHASGHYLTAIAQAYAGTAYDATLHTLFEEKMNHMVDGLYELSRMSGYPQAEGGPHESNSAAVPPGPGKDGYDSDLSADGIRTDFWNWGAGYISAYPPDQFIMLEQGAFYGTGNDQIWAPYYTLHKILAGLLDCYELGGNDKALEIAAGMGGWVTRRLRELPEQTRISMWNRYIAGEYGGMNEAMARLYRITEDERFLECAKLFDNTEFFFGSADHDGGLVCNVDTLRGKHANQHIPQITGALETYRDTQDPDYYRVVRNFWDICTHSYMYAIGGVAGARNPNNAECFTAEPDTLFRNGLSDGGQNETCATYNLLKLGRRLFLYEADAGLMDYYERALYNHILASVAEHDAGNTYHVPLNPGAIKQFGNAAMNGFTCCNGTALESATKLQNTIYFKSADDSALYVNLYVPSTLNWRERGIKVVQKTQYPYADTSQLILQGSGEFTLCLRVPSWATDGFRVSINGEEQAIDASPGSYVSLKRTWSDGDVVSVQLPMDFHLMPLMDQPNIAGIFYGPVLLAAEEEGGRTDWRTIELDPEQIGSSFRGDSKTLRFEAGGARLKPFFETYGHHSVYLEIVPTHSEKERF